MPCMTVCTFSPIARRLDARPMQDSYRRYRVFCSVQCALCAHKSSSRRSRPLSATTTISCSLSLSLDDIPSGSYTTPESRHSRSRNRSGSSRTSRLGLGGTSVVIHP